MEVFFAYVVMCGIVSLSHTVRSKIHHL